MSENREPRDDPQDLIYLDNNATTRPYPQVIEAVSYHLAQSFANPGSRHAPGRTARRVLEEARESMASLLGADPDEIVFTSGGTEATNMAIFGLAGDGRGTVALTAGEHPATIEACRALEHRGCTLLQLDVDGEGRLVPDQFADLPWDQMQLVTLILAHNETGVIQDVEPLAELCRDHHVPLHLDAVQAVGKIPVNFHQLGATALSLGAHKFHGPRGVGALLVRRGTELAPLLFGGHQESGRRPGTEPVALIAGMAAALELWHRDRQRRVEQVTNLRNRLEASLLETCAPAVVNGNRRHRLPNTVNIAFPGLEGEALFVALELQNVACSLGSTCASGSAEPAPSLVAMGCPDEIIRASVRFSVSTNNTIPEIDAAVLRISQVVRRLRQSTAAPTNR